MLEPIEKDISLRSWTKRSVLQSSDMVARVAVASPTHGSVPMEEPWELGEGVAGGPLEDPPAVPGLSLAEVAAVSR